MDDQTFSGMITMLRDGAARVEAALQSTPADRWDDGVHTGDGFWTRRQILAHIAANDRRQLVRVRIGAGIPLATDAEAHVAELRLNEWNQARVDERATSSIADLLAEMRANRAALIDLLTSLTPEQPARPMPFRGEPTPLEEMIPTLLGHLDQHADEIASWSESAK